MTRTIHVTGVGKMSVSPDTIRVVINLLEVEKAYEKAITTSMEQVKTIKACLQDAGIQEEDIKTGSFSIDLKKENYQTIDKRWKERVLGFQFKQAIIVEFPLESRKLGKVVYQLVHSSIHPTFTIYYLVKDAAYVKNRLLEKAVNDSREKASVLANAANETLGSILSIDYSWKEIEIISRETEKYKGLGNCFGAPDFDADYDEGYDIDVNPDNIDLSDTVTIQWAML